MPFTARPSVEKLGNQFSYQHSVHTLGEDFWSCVSGSGQAPLGGWGMESTPDSELIMHSIVSPTSVVDPLRTMEVPSSHETASQRVPLVDAHLSKTCSSRMDVSAKSPWAKFCTNPSSPLATIASTTSPCNGLRNRPPKKREQDDRRCHGAAAWPGNFDKDGLVTEHAFTNATADKGR